MLVLFLLCAFRSGSDRFYFKRAEGVRADGKDVFFYFRIKNAVDLIRFYLLFYFIKLLILFFSLLPFIVCVCIVAAYSSGVDASFAVFNVLLVTCAVLFVHGIIFFFRFNSFLFVARYGFATGYGVNAVKLIRFSCSCMKNERGNLFRRRLSFIPWFLSCVFLLPISFVRSYYNLSMAQLAQDLIKKHLQKQ